MGRTRVLVVDDEVIFRHIVTRVLAEDPEMEVVGTAGDGEIALRRLAQHEVDVVTLDVDMPVMDGLAALQAIRATYPGLPVVMMSAFDKPGAREMQALELGADDCVAKAPASGSTVNAIEWLRQRLLPRLKQVRGKRAAASAPPTANVRPVRAIGSAPMPVATLPSRVERVDVVAIGASTGGPQALAAVLAALPEGFPVPIVMVQHMPPDFTRLLAERLTKTTRLLVREAIPGALLAPGEAWIAPGDHHMVVLRTSQGVVVRINTLPPENSCRPAVDPLFRSVGEVFGAHALGVVLTGMGCDGMRGAEEMRRVGAQVIVQDESTSVVWGMPGAVVQAGLANKVLPLASIAAEIVGRVGVGRTAQVSAHRDAG